MNQYQESVKNALGEVLKGVVFDTPEEKIQKDKERKEAKRRLIDFVHGIEGYDFVTVESQHSVEVLINLGGSEIHVFTFQVFDKPIPEVSIAANLIESIQEFVSDD